MREVRFRDPAGTIRTGEWLGDSEGYARFGDRTYPIGEVDVLAPCEPSKIVCIGRNYADHAAERDSVIPDRPLLLLEEPNAVASHDSTVRLPAGKERTEHEADAMAVVAGFACGNGLSNRDDQRVERNWVRGKAFDNAAPFGPVLAPPEEVPADATIRLWVNGELRQDGSRADLVFSIPELVAEITTTLTLEAGDVILTGTPEGVGPLADSDEIEIGVEGIGTLRHSVQVP